MIVDTSTIPAILFGEPDATGYEKAIATAWPRRMSEATLLEAAMVVESRSGTAAGHELLLETVSIVLVPVTTGHADAARRA